MTSHENYPPDLHLICASCWERLRPLYTEEIEVDGFCCFCGALVDAGIFLRHDPKNGDLVCNVEVEVGA